MLYEHSIAKQTNVNNNEQLFTELVNTYQERVYFHVRRMVVSHDEANDVTQNTWIKVWENLATFKVEASYFTWIYRIATNEALMHLRKRNRRFLNFTDQPLEVQSVHFQSHFTGDEVLKKLHLAIATLPSKQQAVFNMRYFEELKFKEISEIMNTSEGALKASYHIAVQKIEKQLQL